MATRSPRRPSSSRPSAGGGSSAAPAQWQSNLPSIDEIRNLPDYVEDGENLSLDPADASAGFLSDENVTILEAAFRKFVYRRRIGDELVDIDVFDDGRVAYPELRLFVKFRRDDNGGQVVEEAYKYGPYYKFGAAKGGTHTRVWPKWMETNKGTPQPRKTAPAVIFIESLSEAGLSVDELKDKGADALVGLKCHISRRKVAGMHERAKALVLVDSIEGVADVSALAATESQKDESPIVASDLEGQLTDIILNLLEDNGGAIEKKDIPTALIDQVEDTDVRRQLMRLSRSKDFLESDDAPWTLDGSTLVQKD